MMYLFDISDFRVVMEGFRDRQLHTYSRLEVTLTFYYIVFLTSLIIVRDDPLPISGNIVVEPDPLLPSSSSLLSSDSQFFVK